MASNTNKRIPVKWVRDRAKKAYEKQPVCHICGTDKDLELHHLHSITRLLEDWATKNSYDISTDDGILAVRDQFIAEHKVELYDMVFTLCNTHHIKLHGVYGKAPLPSSVDKQARWIEIQRQKYQAGDRDPVPQEKRLNSFFSEFT